MYLDKKLNLDYRFLSCLTAQAVERQLIDLKEVQDKAESDKQRWLTALLDIHSQYQVIYDH
jgi:hypothetical protein